MTAVPSFPPLFTGLAAGPANPFRIACDQARRGTDAGLLAWSIGPERLRAALVLAPETPLEASMAAYYACGVGLQNALGALAPPEVAVHMEWTGGIRVNGGHCGALTVAASSRDPVAVPDWLVIGLDLTMRQPPEWEPGETPDWTALFEEGCGEIDAVELLEAWSRHTLVWINELDSPGGRAKLHREWEGLAWQRGAVVVHTIGGARLEGQFLGVDEDFGMLLKSEAGTSLTPASKLIVED